MSLKSMQIVPGTPVYNTHGKRLGRVTYFHQGTAKHSPVGDTAEDTQEMEMPFGPEAYALFDRFDLPLERREQLFSRGFVKVEDSRRSREQYFLAEQVAITEDYGIIVRETLPAHAV